MPIRSSRALQRARCSTGVMAIEVTTTGEPSRRCAGWCEVGGFLNRKGAGDDRARVYIVWMKRFFIALAIAGLMGLLLLVAGTAQNKGCFPWQTAITTGGGAFSEGDRSQTFCR